jgi:hypothetical protein
MKEKICSNCGIVFSCGAEGGAEGCWCVALPHLPVAAVSGRDCFCPKCLTVSIQIAGNSGDRATDREFESTHGVLAHTVEGTITAQLDQQSLLLEGEDYYSEDGLIVFTASYHRHRGYCCENACRHCPYKG